MANVRAHVFIEGWVQGVFYRAWTKDTALKLGLSGWVRNLADGRVELVCEGEKKEVNKLIELIKEGPRMAKVSHIDINWEEALGEFKNFEIVA